MKKTQYRVEVNAFGNAYNVEKLVGRVWIRVIGWLSPEVAEAWQVRLRNARKN